MNLKKKLIIAYAALTIASLGAFTYKGFSVEAQSILNTSSELGIFRDLTIDEVKGYYSTISKGTKGDDLLEDLQAILKNGQRKVKYGSGDTSSTSWNAYYLLERDWEKSPLTTGEITSQTYSKTDIWTNILYSTSNIYIENSINSGSYKYIDESGNTVTVACQNSKVQFDREHVLPKSFGFNGTNDRYKSLTAGCDMQNLHAGEHNGNSSGHSNYPYGTVAVKNSSTQIVSGITGEVIGYTGNNAKGIKVFEPLDEDKGDIARTVFYMCSRYHTYEELGNNDNTPAITLSDSATSTTTLDPEQTRTSPAQYGELSDLLAWNKLDPVNEFEIHRNNLCYNAVQYNRNPFIDYPQWADVAFSTSELGVDINTTDGVEGGSQIVNNNGLKASSSITSLYQNDTLDLSKLSFKYKNDDNESVLNLTNLTYQLSIDGIRQSVQDLNQYSFPKAGLCTIKFIYSLNGTNYSDTISFNVLSYYDLTIKNLSSVATKIKDGQTYNFDSLELYLNVKGVETTKVSEYSVRILDSKDNLISTDKNYQFKEGSYKIELSYVYEGQTLSTTYNLIVAIATWKLIVIAAVLIILLIIVIIVLIKISKNKKAKKQIKRTAKKIIKKSVKK